jgi:hypothetical protein
MTTNKKLPSKISSSTAAAAKKKPVADHSNTPNLESFSCLWLDHDVNSTEDNRETQQKLRQVINHLRTFSSGDECKEYIQRITHEKIVLIVSGSLGRQVVPRLHQLPQLSACYVFCQDKQANKQWASEYHKVVQLKLLTYKFTDSLSLSHFLDQRCIYSTF